MTQIDKGEKMRKSYIKKLLEKIKKREIKDVKELQEYLDNPDKLFEE